MFSCQSKYKKSQASLDFIYVPKNWNLFKIQWWHLISFSGICRYLFWTSFYTTLFFPINREIYPNEIYMLQIPKVWIRTKICDNYPSLMQDDACCKNDINQQLIKITASLHYQHQTNIFHMRSLPNAILGRRRSYSTLQRYERYMPTLERCRVMTIKRCMDLERSIRRHGKHETILT